MHKQIFLILSFYFFYYETMNHFTNLKSWLNAPNIDCSTFFKEGILKIVNWQCIEKS